MASQLRTASVLLGVFTLLTGGLYPLCVTLAAQSLWPEQANGSLVRSGDAAIGSALVGQAFAAPRYFWGRPSATTPGPYNAAASGASNLGPTHPALVSAVQARAAALRAADPALAARAVPVDLVTASASGLDPDISPASALYQVGRVARARGLPASRVRELVLEHVTQRTFGVLGEPRVNVLALNLALDALSAHNALGTTP